MAQNPLRSTETPPGPSAAERRKRYAAAMDAVTGGICPTDLIDAVMAVADAEIRATDDAAYETARRLLDQRQEMAEERYAWQERGDRAEAENRRLRARMEDWRTAAGAGMRLTDELRAERDALAAGVPLVCSDERHKTKVFALQQALERVHAECDAIDRDRERLDEGCESFGDGYTDAVARIRLALDRGPVAAPEGKS